MRRRGFIHGIAACAAWPLAARAQQSERVRQVGMLLSSTADDAVHQTWVGAFLQGLAQSGWIIGSNVRIETRWAGPKADDIRRYAQELVALAPDVILAHGGSTVRPLLQSTRSQESPKGIAMCATCTLFVAPRSCKLVEGDISPSGWCNAYAMAD